MTNRMSDELDEACKLREAQALGFSVELLAFCEAQRSFIDTGLDEVTVRDRGEALAREARRRRMQPEGILLAMQCGGCYRSQSIGDGAPQLSKRYSAALGYVLAAYYAPVSRSSAWLVRERPDEAP